MRRIVGVVVALAVTFAIAALSRVPYAAAGSDGALIRLSWRTSGAYVEECRTLSEEERERLPIHMRRDQVCERRMLPYRLRVRIDGVAVHEGLVHPAGARQDRPLYVFRELPVAPGEYQVEVLWERERSGPATGGAEVGAAADPAAGVGTPLQDPSAPGSASSVPERLELTTTLRLQRGDVTLLTYDVDRQALVARGRGLADSRPR